MLLRTPLAGHGTPLSGDQRSRHSGHNFFAGLPRLQTTRGKPARSMTIDEWTVFMEELKAKIHSMLDSKLHPLAALRWMSVTGGSHLTCPPIFSFDNASCHVNKGALAHLGLIDGVNWVRLPPHSGDLHRVIERVHARLCGAFQDWLYEGSTILSMHEYCQKLESLFYSTQTANIHEADISTIHELYQQVVSKEGGLPPARYR